MGRAWWGPGAGGAGCGGGRARGAGCGEGAGRGGGAPQPEPMAKMPMLPPDAVGRVTLATVLPGSSVALVA
jgi:hypothetical protein